MQYPQIYLTSVNHLLTPILHGSIISLSNLISIQSSITEITPIPNPTLISISP